jgi:hypothetical protein
MMLKPRRVLVSIFKGPNSYTGKTPSKSLAMALPIFSKIIQLLRKAANG